MDSLSPTVVLYTQQFVFVLFCLMLLLCFGEAGDGGLFVNVSYADVCHCVYVEGGWGALYVCPCLSVSTLTLHLSLNRRGRWGTTDDFTTSFLHFSPFSAVEETTEGSANALPLFTSILLTFAFQSPCTKIMSFFGV